MASTTSGPPCRPPATISCRCASWSPPSARCSPRGMGDLTASLPNLVHLQRRLGHGKDCRRKHRFLGLHAPQAWPGVRVTSSLEAQGDRGEEGACETSHAWGVPTLAIHDTMLM